MAGTMEVGRREMVAMLGTSLLLPEVASAQRAAPVVATRSGSIRGAIDRGIATFKGIPYGAPTGGAARFRRSTPPARWAGVRDTIAYGAQCPQVGILATGIYANRHPPQPSSEDCLFLNVWTPATGAGKRPVMVWLHGGGFESGSGSNIWYDGVNLCRRGDVVVVTINHRLNVFGFAYFGALDASYGESGNAGMLDIVDALGWVRDNIAAFGGDPRNVTVFGESGGGRKISVLAAMPEAKGLFHKAIVQSGSAIGMRAPADASVNARRLFEAAGVAPGDLAALRRLPTAALLAAGLKASGATSASLGGATNFVPVVDGINLPRHPFTPDAPPQSADVPMMIGWTRTETSRLIGARDPATMTLDETTLKPKLASYIPADRVDRVVEAFRRANPGCTPTELFFLITTATSVRQEAYQQLDRRNALAGSAPVYAYCLAWKTPVDGGRWHAPHALDVPFVFDTVADAPSLAGPVNVRTRQLTRDMGDAWLAFAHTGNPATRRLAWPAYTAGAGAVMVFDDRSSAVPHAYAEEKAAVVGMPVKRSAG